jgi:hypothetical protein
MTTPAKDPRTPAIAATLALALSLAIGTDCAAAWKAEEGVDVPSYAVTEPAHSNLNIDSVVLMCEAAADANVLQLKIYLTDDGPLRPDGVAVESLKADPRAEISIDGRDGRRLQLDLRLAVEGGRLARLLGRQVEAHDHARAPGHGVEQAVGQQREAVVLVVGQYGELVGEQEADGKVPAVD